MCIRDRSKCSRVCMVSLMGSLVYKLVMSKDANLELCGMWMCSVFLTSSMLFLTEVLLLRFMFFLIILCRCLAILWEGACCLLYTSYQFVPVLLRLIFWPSTTAGLGSVHFMNNEFNTLTIATTFGVNKKIIKFIPEQYTNGDNAQLESVCSICIIVIFRIVPVYCGIK